MTELLLDLPNRVVKPRQVGITSLLETGLSTSAFRDLIESHGELVDFVKFGWGTALVTKDIKIKCDILKHHGIEFYLGGTLFEKAWGQGKVNELYRYIQSLGTTWIEISNGTVELQQDEKLGYIKEAKDHFNVLSEVGFKEQARSAEFYPAEWVKCINEELTAGAKKCITEARESGKSGICRGNGEVRYGLINEILNSGIDADNLIFEAPNKELQTYFIKLVGANVNLGNISIHDIIPLETLRLGLRSDTLEVAKR